MTGWGPFSEDAQKQTPAVQQARAGTGRPAEGNNPAQDPQSSPPVLADATPLQTRTGGGARQGKALKGNYLCDGSRRDNLSQVNGSEQHPAYSIQPAQPGLAAQRHRQGHHGQGGSTGRSVLPEPKHSWRWAEAGSFRPQDPGHTTE